MGSNDAVFASSAVSRLSPGGKRRQCSVERLCLLWPGGSQAHGWDRGGAVGTAQGSDTPPPEHGPECLLGLPNRREHRFQRSGPGCLDAPASEPQHFHCGQRDDGCGPQVAHLRPLQERFPWHQHDRWLHRVERKRRDHPRREGCLRHQCQHPAQRLHLLFDYGLGYQRCDPWLLCAVRLPTDLRRRIGQQLRQLHERPAQSHGFSLPQRSVLNLHASADYLSNGIVASCTSVGNYHIVLWPSLAGTLILLYVAYTMAYMQLDMDSLLYEPEPTAH